MNGKVLYGKYGYTIKKNALKRSGAGARFVDAAHASISVCCPLKQTRTADHWHFLLYRVIAFRLISANQFINHSG
jgi:hypothetical protein